MRGKAKIVLVPMLAVASITGAQSSVPAPEVGVLVRQTALQQRFAESKEQNYVFREDIGANKLNRACTWAPRCPAPFGVPGMQGVGYFVLGEWRRHFEVFWLDGTRVARIMPAPENNYANDPVKGDWTLVIPTSSSELAIENRRVDSEVAEAKALRAEGKDPSSPDEPPRILLSKMLELCTFSNPRRQRINGRSTILLDFARNPSVKLANANEALLKFFSGTIGIDEDDHAVQHVQGIFLADVKLDGGNIRIRKGTRVTITNRRVGTGIWLLSNLEVWGEGSYFAFAMDGQGNIFAGNYRKFRATGRILPGFTEVPINSKPAHAVPR